MDFEKIVIQAAEQLNLPTSGAASLRDLDSIAVLDFVVALERISGITIPASALRPDNFDSVETVASMLSELIPSPSRPA